MRRKEGAKEGQGGMNKEGMGDERRGGLMEWVSRREAGWKGRMETELHTMELFLLQAIADKVDAASQTDL